MIARKPSSSFATHEVTNQPPPLEGRNLFMDNAPLVEAMEREGGGWVRERAVEAGAFWGGEPRSGAGWRTRTRRCCARTTGTATASTRSSSIPPGTS